MKPERRGLAIPAACFATILVVVVVSIVYLSTLPTLPTSLPVPAGIAIGPPGLELNVTIEGQPADLVGAWHADRGGLFWVSAWHVSPGPIRPVCAASPDWRGSVNVSLLPGSYLVGLSPNPNGGTIVITEAIRLVYPASSPVASGFVEGEGCSPPNLHPPPSG